MRHFDVQLMAVSSFTAQDLEMKTGEEKTLWPRFRSTSTP